MEQKPNQKEALEMLKQMDTLCVQQNLAYYSQHGDKDKTELLLIAGLNPNDPHVDDKKKKQFILHNACIYSTAAIVELLLKYGANINLLDDSGETALLKAVENNKTDIIKVLIQNGADLNVMTGAKINALYIAEQKKNTEAIELLKKAGAHQMTDDEIKVHKKRKLVGKISLVVALAGCIWVAQICSTHSSSSGRGSSSSSGVTHTCINCNKSYSGYGFATVGGEEYALDKDQGNQYCSRACAKASRTGKFKNL